VKDNRAKAVVFMNICALSSAANQIIFKAINKSGGVTVFGETVSPIKIELGILANFPYIKESLLIMDDARGFDGTNSYLTIEEIKSWAKELNLGKVYSVLDMIIVEPNNK
jgi:long-subunit acyl-CoA synthetase (AMP-forming)